MTQGGACPARNNPDLTRIAPAPDATALGNNVHMLNTKQIQRMFRARTLQSIARFDQSGIV
ncbi:MAG: hypothetical protein JRN67_11410 [Nitrososphaerota archaeon]|nr:hypothetical protein [Nitrososphaerota archaeon]